MNHPSLSVLPLEKTRSMPMGGERFSRNPASRRGDSTTPLENPGRESKVVEENEGIH